MLTKRENEREGEKKAMTKGGDFCFENSQIVVIPEYITVTDTGTDINIRRHEEDAEIRHNIQTTNSLRHL